MSRETTLVHRHDDTRLESVLVTPDTEGPFPGLLLVHEFTGLRESTLGHARRLSRMGYAVLAADIYGPAIRPKNEEEARTVHRIFRDDRSLMRERASACLDALRACPEVARHRPCALGLSFGGGAVLELARSGASLDKAVSIYGYLDTSIPAAPGDIHASLHVIHLEKDPVVPSEHAAAFTAEMQHANTPFRMKRLNGPAHGFMNPDGPTYNQGASEKVWGMVERILKG